METQEQLINSSVEYPSQHEQDLACVEFHLGIGYNPSVLWNSDFMDKPFTMLEVFDLIAELKATKCKKGIPIYKQLNSSDYTSNI